MHTGDRETRKQKSQQGIRDRHPVVSDSFTPYTAKYTYPFERRCPEMYSFRTCHQNIEVVDKLWCEQGIVSMV